MILFIGALAIIAIGLFVAAHHASRRRDRRTQVDNLYRAHRRQRVRTTIITPSRRDPLVVGDVTFIPRSARIRDLPNVEPV
jgi:hypothetical protein